MLQHVPFAFGFLVCCRQYKVYDMAAYYSLLFTLPAANVAELKLGLQYLLLVVTTPTQQPMSASITTVATTADKGEQPMDCSSVRASTHTTSNSDLAACPVVHLLVYAAANGQVGVCSSFVLSIC